MHSNGPDQLINRFSLRHVEAFCGQRRCQERWTSQGGAEVTLHLALRESVVSRGPVQAPVILNDGYLGSCSVTWVAAWWTGLDEPE